MLLLIRQLFISEITQYHYATNNDNDNRKTDDESFESIQSIVIITYNNKVRNKIAGIKSTCNKLIIDQLAQMDQ